MSKATWTTGAGTKITVEYELITSKTIWADGHQVEVDCHEIRETVTANGKSIRSTVGHMTAEEISGKTCTGYIQMDAGILPITVEMMREIAVARAEVAGENKTAASIETASEYEDGCSRIEHAMRCGE